MIQLLVLITIYTVLLVICISFSPKGLMLTPQLCYVACFIPGTFYALFYVNKWYLNISLDTFCVFAGGAILFVLCSLIAQEYFKRRYKSVLKASDYGKKGKVFAIRIQKYKLIVFIIISVIAILWSIAELRLKYGNNLTLAIARYRNASVDVRNNPDFDFSFLLANIRFFVTNACFVWTYLIVHALLYRYKTNFLLIVANLVLGIICDLLSGARGNSILIILSAITYYAIINSYKNNWTLTFSSKAIFKILVSVFTILLLFQSVGNALGRIRTDSNSDIIAEYLSAEIKNLDTAIETEQLGHHISEWRTLRGLLNAINEYTPFNIDLKPIIKHPSGYINGYSLGNVLTNYYSYIYDLDFWGVLLFVPIMAFLSQAALWKSIKSIKKSQCRKIDIPTIIYGLVISGVALSFFSDRFFGLIISSEIFKRILFIYVLKYILQSQLKFKLRVSASKKQRGNSDIFLYQIGR